MANILQAFGTATAFPTLTNLTSLAFSPTAGWRSTAVDNTTNLYDDVLITLELASAAYGVAAGNSVYIFAYGLITGTAYTSQGNAGAAPDGNEGTITLPNVTSAPVNMPLIGAVTQLGTAAQNIGPFSLAKAYGGILPIKWGIVIINNTAANFASAVARYQELKYTVA